MPELWRGDIAFVSPNLLPEFVSKNFLGGSRNCRGAAAKLNVTGEWGGEDFLDVLACRPLNCPGQSGPKPSQFVCFTRRDYFKNIIKFTLHCYWSQIDSIAVSLFSNSRIHKSKLQWDEQACLITNTFQSKSVFKGTPDYATLRHNIQLYH